MACNEQELILSVLDGPSAESHHSTTCEQEAEAPLQRSASLQEAPEEVACALRQPAGEERQAAWKAEEVAAERRAEEAAPST